MDVFGTPDELPEFAQDTYSSGGGDVYSDHSLPALDDVLTEGESAGADELPQLPRIEPVGPPWPALTPMYDEVPEPGPWPVLPELDPVPAADAVPEHDS